MSSDAVADAFSFSVFHCWEYNFVGLNHVLRIPPTGALLLFSLSLCCYLDELGVTHKLGWVSHTHSWVLTCRFCEVLSGWLGWVPASVLALVPSTLVGNLKWAWGTHWEGWWGLTILSSWVFTHTLGWGAHRLGWSACQGLTPLVAVLTHPHCRPPCELHNSHMCLTGITSF